MKSRRLLRCARECCRRALVRLHRNTGDPGVNKEAASRLRWNIASMNRPVAVCATIQRRVGAHVVMSVMALQTQRRLAHVEQIRIRRTMRIMTVQAALRYRSVLICERPAILRMAAQT